MHGYLEHGDDITYKQKFRVTRATFDYIHEKLQSTGYIKDSMCRNSALRISARFKVAVSLYFLAHGCCDADMVGDVASLGASTVELYLKMFCEGALQVLRPIYMPATPPSEAQLTSIKAEFAKRRGIPCVAMAVDGTHVPFRGGPDYRNYKGWTSILALAYVNSFYLFVDADVGAAGRAGDNGVLASSWLLREIKAHPEAWLGPGGMVAADGGASDGGNFLLNPIPDAREPEDVWYNFCHSSTRFLWKRLLVGGRTGSGSCCARCTSSTRRPPCSSTSRWCSTTCAPSAGTMQWTSRMAKTQNGRSSFRSSVRCAVPRAPASRCCTAHMPPSGHQVVQRRMQARPLCSRGSTSRLLCGQSCAMMTQLWKS